LNTQIKHNSIEEFDVFMRRRREMFVLKQWQLSSNSSSRTSAGELLNLWSIDEM
jgi:hypothetical protein